MRPLRLILLTLVAACGRLTDPVVRGGPPDVVEFATSRLPNLRSVDAVVTIPSEGFLIFSAAYGEPQDCQAGCFYLGGWGLQYAGRIGWIELQRSTGLERVPGDYYDVRVTDDYLFSDALWDRLRTENVWVMFRIMLACDGDTPANALERLADRLPAEGWPLLADLLVDVAQRRDLRAVAEIVAKLGQSQYDFSYSRAKAQSALASWPGQFGFQYCGLLTF
jgi:hypothetical protein